MSPFCVVLSCCTLASFHSTGFFLSLKYDLFGNLFNPVTCSKNHDITCQVINAGGRVFNSLRVFLPSDVRMGLGWYSFMRGVGLGVWNCTVLWKTVRRSVVFRFWPSALYFLHFSFHVSLSLILLCMSTLALYHFEV